MSRTTYVTANHDARHLVTTTLAADFNTATAAIAAATGLTAPPSLASTNVLHSRKTWADYPRARVTPAAIAMQQGSGQTGLTVDVGVLIEDSDADPDVLDDRIEVYLSALMSIFDSIRAADGSYYCHATEGDGSPQEVDGDVWVQGCAVRVTINYATAR